MKLVHKPSKVLLRSYSMWCIYLAGILDIAPYVVPYLDGFIPTWASIALLVASPLARIIQQETISGAKDEQA